MRKTTKLALTLTCAAVMGFTAAPAKANDLINSSVSGYVGGDITQSVSGYGANADLNVGSIDTEFSYGPGGAYRNLEAEGRVGGDVTQIARTGGGWVSPDFKLEAQIGNIKATAATNSYAFGAVDGDITQVVDGESSAELHVGSMMTDNGTIENSTAVGFVGGDVTQRATNGAKASARVGSLR